MAQKKTSITDPKGFSHIVIGNENTYTSPLEMDDNIFNIIDGQRVDAGKGLIEKDE